MSRRVAVFTTCICLVCSLIFTILFSHLVMNSTTASAVDELENICRMSAEYLDNAAFSLKPSVSADELKVILNKIATLQNVNLAYSNENGAVLTDTRFLGFVSQDYSGNRDFIDASNEGAGIDLREYAGVNTNYVTIKLDNSCYLTASKAVPSYVASLMKTSGGLFVLVGLLLLACTYIITRLIVNKCDNLLMGSRNIREAFSEGRYDERIAFNDGGGSEAGRKINEFANRIESKLTAENNRNQALSVVMNQMQNGMLAVNSDCVITLITPIAKKLLCVFDQWEGKPVSELSKDFDLEPAFREGMAQHGVYTSEIAVRGGLNGRAKTPVRLYISPTRQGDEVIGAIAILEDITELRSMERIRNDFTANVSHELKTPLTSIIGFTETMMDAPDLPAERRQYCLEIIHMEATRLKRLVNDILSISKLEAGDKDVSLERIEFYSMAKKVCDVLQFQAKQKNIDLSINEVNEPIYVWGNKDRVEQLQMNLIENATKYNREGGSVHVSINASENNVYFIVRDTGIGIAEEHIGRLFERFYRVDKGRSRQMGGTGLGLAIVKHIAQSMGGNIAVTSQLDVGSEFTVTLPRYIPKAEEFEDYFE